MDRICTWTHLWVIALCCSMTLSGDVDTSCSRKFNFQTSPLFIINVCNVFWDKNTSSLATVSWVYLQAAASVCSSKHQKTKCTVCHGENVTIWIVYSAVFFFALQFWTSHYSIPGFVVQQCTSLSLKFLPFDHLNSSHQNQFCTLPLTFISTYLRLKIKLSQADWKFNTLIDFGFPSILLPNWPFNNCKTGHQLNET